MKKIIRWLTKLVFLIVIVLFISRNFFDNALLSMVDEFTYEFRINRAESLILKNTDFEPIEFDMKFEELMDLYDNTNTKYTVLDTFENLILYDESNECEISFEAGSPGFKIWHIETFNKNHDIFGVKVGTPRKEVRKILKKKGFKISIEPGNEHYTMGSVFLKPKLNDEDIVQSIYLSIHKEEFDD